MGAKAPLLCYRDSNGVLLAAAAKKLEVCWEARIAEAAARYGVMSARARQMGYTQVWLECDALEVATSISQEHGGLPQSFSYVRILLHFVNLPLLLSVVM